MLKAIESTEELIVYMVFVCCFGKILLIFSYIEHYSSGISS